jgi:ABC-type transport system involved in cytochrome c biogenesis permease subunit
MHSLFFIMSVGLSALYLSIAFFAGAFFYTGRRGFSAATDVFILLTLPVHIAYLVTLGITEQKIPLTSFFEALSVIAFFLTLTSSILHVAFKVKSAAVFAFPVIFVFQLLSTMGTRIVYLDENLFHSVLFGSHTLTTLLGYAAFAYSMIWGLMYLNLFRELKGKKLQRMFDHLPPLELLDRMNEISLVTGFVCLTAGIILGSVLAHRVWGEVPFRDPKILLSGLLWVIYVLGIVLRRLLRWNGRRLSYFGVFGFIVVIGFAVTLRVLLTTLHRF